MSSARSRDANARVERPEGEVVVALVGNPNVGKSTIFNALTGLGVSTAHYPGTTREVLSATARAGVRRVGVIDLPGTYAIAGAEEDEWVVRRALADLVPDVLVMVVDPLALARNLYLVLEAIDLGHRVVVALNLADEARRAGVLIDASALSQRLGVKVVTTVATRGVGIMDLVDAAFDAAVRPAPTPLGYGQDLEALIQPLVTAWQETESMSAEAARATTLAMIAGHEEPFERANDRVRSTAADVQAAVKSRFDEEPAVHIARERHGLAGVLADAVTRPGSESRRVPDLWSLTTSPVTGVPLVVLTVAAVFAFLFFAGEFLAGLFSSAWASFASPAITALITSLAGEGIVARVLLWGFDAGIEAGLAIGLPYILTFYFLLGLLEDTGYLNSLAFLTDRVMHRLGLHGRAIVPLVAAAGCNVPALVAAEQLPGKRERLIASTLILFIPCSARTAVILGAVGHYIGMGSALIVFLLVMLCWVAIAIALQRLLPGRSEGLVMEMFGFRRPAIRRVFAKAWEQFREFLFVAMPIVVIGSLVLGLLYETGWLSYLSIPLKPFVEDWLGLPAVAGVTLVAGMLRKELSLQLLAALSAAAAGFAGAELTDVMTQANLIVYVLVNAIALPCVSSVAIFWNRHGWRTSLVVIAAGVAVALILGGVVARVLPFFGIQ